MLCCCKRGWPWDSDEKPMRSRLLKISLRTTFVLLAIVVIAIAVLTIAEGTYLRRLFTYPQRGILDIEWFVPKEYVYGEASPPLPRASPGDLRIEQDALEATARLAEEKNTSALLVLHDGQVVLERYWHGHAPDRWTNSASMAKTITALLIGIAIGEGAIPSLDASASQWIALWRDDGRREITIRHLLQMNSGLRSQGEYDDPFSDASYLALGDDMRYIVDTTPLAAEPGTTHDYNNTDFQVLGFILEEATGKRYAEYLSEKLWRPIGCADGALWLERKGGSARTFGFLFARAEDWARIGQLMLQQGRWEDRQIVPREHIAAMRTPSPTEPRYGLGLWLANNEHQALREDQAFLDTGTFYLDGRSKQRVYICPDHNLVIVRVGEDGESWDDAALSNAVIRGLR